MSKLLRFELLTGLKFGTVNFRSIKEIDLLAQLKNLSSLEISNENHIVSIPIFRSYTINWIRTLVILNCRQITESERLSAYERYNHFKVILSKNERDMQPVSAAQREQINLGTGS
jgi:hypothetical protein